VAQANPTLSLASSGGSAVYGQPITLTATLYPGAGTTGGTVTFLDGGTPLGTAAVDGSGKAALITSGLGVGSHAITASYGGNANSRGGTSGATSETVGQAATHLVFEAHAVRKRRRRKLTAIGLNARVESMAPGNGVPSGRIRFMFKKKTIGIATLINGQATLTRKVNAVLKKSLTIVYYGDPNFLPDTVTTPKLVQKSLQS
jgi:hypothetical protein